MKQLTILLLLLSCIACKKETSEPIKVIPPQPVTFTVNTRTDAAKHIQAELWAVDTHGIAKRTLVAKIDTIVITKHFNQTLIQNVFPTWKCIANIKVNIVDNYDTISIDIKSNLEAIGRSNSCALSEYGITDTYLKIYNDSDK